MTSGRAPVCLHEDEWCGGSAVKQDGPETQPEAWDKKGAKINQDTGRQRGWGRMKGRGRLRGWGRLRAWFKVIVCLSLKLCFCFCVVMTLVN